MNVLLLGGNGQLGPHVVQALENSHVLRITDVNDLSTKHEWVASGIVRGALQVGDVDPKHEYVSVDSSDVDQVVAAAEDMDAIINLSVMRHDRRLAFDVNARGCYNMMIAAREHGIERLINTGPFYAVTGPTYERFDHGIHVDVPHQPGTYLYAITKSLGQEICTVMAQEQDAYVLHLLFYMFVDPENHTVEAGSPIANVGHDLVPYTVSWRDAAEACRLALDIDLDTLDSRSESFFIFPDLPHGKFSNEKAKRVLGWKARDTLERFWRKKKGE